jgi:hypothetical protein
MKNKLIAELKKVAGYVINHKYPKYKQINRIADYIADSNLQNKKDFEDYQEFTKKIRHKCKEYQLKIEQTPEEKLATIKIPNQDDMFWQKD